MAVRRSMSQGLSVPDQTSPEAEREFLREGNLSIKKERNITILQNTATQQETWGESREEEDIWLPVTFRLPRSLIAELGLFSAQQRAKGKKPWKKQEIIAHFLRQGLRGRREK
jgi:hypothetical protein